MKYLKLFESMAEVEIKKICEKYGIVNWSINKDGLVDVDGYVSLSSEKLTKSPLHFGRVTGHFYCFHNNLTTLVGAPEEVGGDFFCNHNQLTTLVGAPREVGGDFFCTNNKLTTLEGAPKEVGGDFLCYDNKLTTLVGAPREVGGDFYCNDNKLTTLEGIPEEISGDFDCRCNKLISLEGAPKEVNGYFSCHNNNLTTLEGAPQYVGDSVYFLPNENLPAELLRFLRWNRNRDDLQKYILKWQKDYAVWRKDGSFNQSNFIQMMEEAQDELQNLKFPK